MKNNNNIIIIGLLSCLTFSVDAALYRWTDDAGKVHYSGSIPASDAQLGHIVLDKNGIKKDIVISAKEKRKIHALKLIAEERKRALASDSKSKELRDLEDSRLLTVFSTERELVKAYEAKFRLAQLTIDLLKARHKKQSKKLEKLENNHERMKDLKYKDAVAREIDDVLDNLKIYQQAITENHVEKDKIHKEFETTLSHYKILASKKDTKY
ncbi:MAG: DUF4124 domain-containing protein [Cocleimonas sp.]